MLVSLVFFCKHTHLELTIFQGWIDINLTVTPTTVPLLFNLLADASLPIRLATSVTLLRIVSKGLKEPNDKLQLLKVLSLGQVLDALESKTRAQQIERADDTDEGEESYREALGKLLNVLGQELAKLTEVSAHTTPNSSCANDILLQECPNDEVRAEATTYLVQIQPVLLRFMADEYDDTCSTVFPLLHVILAGVSNTNLHLIFADRQISVQTRPESLARAFERFKTRIFEFTSASHLDKNEMGGRTRPGRCR